MRQQFDSFDRLVLGIIAVLLLAIGVVVLVGNNVGVRVEGYTTSAATIRVRFYQDMETKSVEQRFKIEPLIEGRTRWNGGRDFIFQPDTPLVSGQTYTVTIERGASTQNNSAALKSDFQFSFSVPLPRVLYLAPAGAQNRDLHLYNLNTGETLRLTGTEWGIADYAISADGQTAAYTLYKEDGTSDIWLYSLATGSTSQITNCVNASCGAPAWKPDGTQISYERDEYDPVFGQAGARRVWTVDLTTVQSTLLFEDTQITGHSPTYAPNGNRVAIFATNPPGILAYDFVNESRVFIENLQGLVGEFSSDSEKLVYPILVRGAIGSTFYTQLEMVDLVAQQRSIVTGESNAPIEDVDGFWRPNHPSQLAVIRRYLDDRYTDGKQIYLLDLENNIAEPLVVHADYTHSSLQWSADGNLIVFQRFNLHEQGARPEIWVYNLLTEELTLVASDAFLPDFTP